MNPTENQSTPLGPSAQDALEHLTPRLKTNDDKFTRDDALAHLRHTDFDAELAATALNELLNKGYLYEVRGELRLP